MDKQFYVYIMSNKKYGTLYIGVTSDIIKRTYEHIINQLNPEWKDLYASITL